MTRRCAHLVALALSLSWCSPARTLASECDGKTAGAHFELGKLASKAGDHAAALAAFEAAYRCAPHHILLYNISQAQVHLGRYAEALTSLERYLRGAEGAHVLSPEQVAEIRQQMEALQRAIARAPGTEQAVPEKGASESTDKQLSDIDAGAAPSRPIPPLSLVLGSVGLLVAGGATVTYFWNDDRHDTWKEVDAELFAARERPLVTSEANAFNELQAQNNERLASIKTANLVTLGLGLGALTALSVGTYLWLSHDVDTQVALFVSHDEVLFRARF